MVSSDPFPVLILSGSSRGIGKALLEEYLDQGYYVFHFSRSENPSSHPNQHYFQLDLNSVEELSSMMGAIARHSIAQQCKRMVLINNAGTLGQIAPLHQIDLNDIASTLQVNLISAMQLSSLFIHHFGDRNKDLKIINISSGAANKAISGWSVYSAGKAGMDIYTQTLALELQELQSPYKREVVSVYPGVVDTKMQAEIRKAKPDQFPDVQRFIDLKNDEQLSQSSQVAQKLYHLDHQTELENGSIIDIRTIELP